MGCGVCGAFPFLAGETTTVTNMGIIYTSSPVFIILISYFFFHEKINFTKIIGLIACLIGVFTIIIKGDLNLLINLQFTIGDLWMLAAAIGWALYSIYLFYWNSELKIFERFTLISFFGALSLLPFYIGEEIFYKQTVFMPEFYFWVIFAAISPGIIAFTLYTVAQKKLGASLTGFTLYVFTVYGAIYGYFLFDEKFENYHFIGTILVFFGIYLAKKKMLKSLGIFCCYFFFFNLSFYIFIISLILKDKYENNEKIKNINIPVLVMHGEADQIVPFWMGKKIFNLASEPKYSYFTKYDDHMMEYDDKLVLALKSFVDSLN